MSVITQILESCLYEPFDEVTKRHIERAIRESCPGNWDYRIEVKETERGFIVTLHFKNSEDATYFRMMGWM